jgi:hypothetical protein
MRAEGLWGLGNGLRTPAAGSLRCRPYGRLVGAGWGRASTADLVLAQRHARTRRFRRILANSAGKSAQPHPPTARPGEASLTAVLGGAASTHPAGAGRSWSRASEQDRRLRRGLRMVRKAKFDRHRSISNALQVSPQFAAYRVTASAGHRAHHSLAVPRTSRAVDRRQPRRARLRRHGAETVTGPGAGTSLPRSRTTLGGVDRWLAAFIDTSRLGSADAQPVTTGTAAGKAFLDKRGALPTRISLPPDLQLFCQYEKKRAYAGRRTGIHG